MGTKYTTESTSSYNTSPPADDGSQTASNQVKWATIKTKLTDVLKTAVDNINTKLVAALDTSAAVKTANYTTVAGDHAKTIEIGSTATSGITIELGDAATMAAGYYVTISNQSAHTQTVGRDTVGDTINGSAANFSLASKTSATFAVNASANGYNINMDAGAVRWAGALPKAWCVFDGTGSNGAKSFTGYGVTGVTKSSTGLYTITWTTAFASSNYAVLATCDRDGSGSPGVGIFVDARTTTTCTVETVVPGTAFTDLSYISVVAFGSQ